MPSELRIKTQFVSSILKKSAEDIYANQTKVASEWGLFEGGSGNLERNLKGHFSLSNLEGSAKLSMRYLTYIRWLDMQDARRQRKKDGYHIYNKILFGYIYGKALPELAFGFTEDVRNKITAELVRIEGMKMPYYKKTNFALKEIANYDRNLAGMISKSMRVGYR